MFEGSFVAIVTPFKDGEFDEETYKTLIDRQIESGTQWIVPCGTTGESPTLSHEEHNRVVEVAVNHCKGRAKVLAGSGSNSTNEAIRLSRHAEECGADGALVITPYYNKPTQRGLYYHFEAVAKAVKIPVILYNVPGRTGVNIEVDTIEALSKLENIAGIKEASGSITKVSSIVSRTNLSILSGEDALTFPMMMVGAKGAISVTANVVPDLHAEMVSNTLRGNYEKARELHDKLFDLSNKLFLETNPIPVKAALSMMGLIREELRLPLCPMSPDKRSILEGELKHLGLI